MNRELDKKQGTTRGFPKLKWNMYEQGKIKLLIFAF